VLGYYAPPYYYGPRSAGGLLLAIGRVGLKATRDATSAAGFGRRYVDAVRTGLAIRDRWLCGDQIPFSPKAYEYPFDPTLRASGLRTSSPARRRSISAGKSYRGRQPRSFLARSLT
jgi:hypothetical protein